MTDSYNGFAYETTMPDVNSPGGRLHRRLLVVAKTHQDASRIATNLLPQAQFKESGSEVLAEARQAGVPDNGAKLL